MRLAPDGLEKLKSEFKAVSPDFTSFDEFNAGAPFIHHEDGWKRKAADYATEHLAQKSKIWRRPKDFVGALNGAIVNARKLALNDQFSGIAWNEDRAALIRNKAHKTDQAYEGLRLRVEAGHVLARTCLEAGLDSARPIHGRLASLHAE